MVEELAVSGAPVSRKIPFVPPVLLAAVGFVRIDEHQPTRPLHRRSLTERIPRVPVSHSSRCGSPLTQSPSTKSPELPVPKDAHSLTINEVDSLMDRAFGSALSRETVPTPGDCPWSDRWMTVSQLSGKHYDLPRGSPLYQPTL